MENNWEVYMYWLLEKMKISQHDLNKYSKLWDLLHNTEFTYILERDNNRLYDGLDLRSDFGVPFDEFIYPCGVLEMLVALSIRMEEDYFGIPGDEHPEELFKIFIENLSLHKFTDKRWNEYEVTKILYDWMDRNFSKDGRGSICPRKKVCRDQRKIEIWDQVIGYFKEQGKEI